MSRPPKWNIYEAAILLNAYVKIENGVLSRQQAITDVSRMLRDRAVAAGVAIDDDYRNTNGISLQLGALQYLMTNGKKGLPRVSKVFQKIVRLYSDEPDEYERILVKATSVVKEPRQAMERDGNIPKSQDDPFLTYLDKLGVGYIDKRPKGGCLWIIDDTRLRDVANVAKRRGIHLTYSEDGGRATRGKSAWWTPQRTDKFIEPDDWHLKARATSFSCPGTREYVEETMSDGNTNDADEVTVANSADDAIYPNTASGFKNWLVSQGVDEDAARNYMLAIAFAGSIANERRFDSSGLYGCNNPSVLRETVGKILRSRVFRRKCKNQIDTYHLAFDWFIKFVESINDSASPGMPAISSTNDRKAATDRKTIADVKPHGANNGGQGHRPSEFSSVTRARTSGNDGHNQNGYGVIERKKSGEYTSNYEGFRRWLLACGFSVGKARSYASAIFDIQKYIRTHDYGSVRLYGNRDSKEIEALANRLFRDREFNRSTRGRSYRLSSALDEFVNFTKGLGPIVEEAADVKAPVTRNIKAELTGIQESGTDKTHGSSIEADGNAGRRTSRGSVRQAPVDFPTVKVEKTQRDVSSSSKTVLSHKFNALTQEELQIIDVMRSRFPNGVRIGSVIEMNKLKRFYREEYGTGLSDAIDIGDLMRRVCLEWSGRAYLIDEETRQTVRNQIESAINQGMRILYYTELYREKPEYYSSKFIQSAEALARLVETMKMPLVCQKNYVMTQRGITLEDEIIRAFGSATCLLVNILHDRLPYIPDSKLVPALSLSDCFVRVRSGEYAVVDRIEFDLTEVNGAVNDVLKRVDDDGFYSLNSLSLPLSLEGNPSLTEHAVRDAFYNKFLSHELERKGQMVAKKGGKTSMREVMRQHCLSLDIATLGELDEYEESLTGKARNAILPIAFETMVRADKETFIRDGRVQFCIEEIDHAISLFVGDGLVSITSITSFTSFPDAGVPWNLYLLESYLSRFSVEYRIVGGPARSTNIGIIHPSKMKFDSYEELLATILAGSAIKLDVESSGDYLLEHGYIARRRSSLVESVTEQARLIRDLRS